MCKLGGASVWTGDVIEPLVTRLVGQRTALPVPRVLASGSLEPPAKGLERWALYEYLEGTNPDRRYRDLEAAVRRWLVADAGRYLGRLHAAFPFERIGGIARDGGQLRLCGPHGWHAVGQEGVGPRPIGGERELTPVLTHGDYQPGNLLVDDHGRVSAILDWGNAHVTHAGYALARAEARFVDIPRLRADDRRRLRRIFREAYARHGDLENGFARRAPVYKLLWLSQSAANVARIARSRRGRTQLWRQLRNGLR